MSFEEHREEKAQQEQAMLSLKEEKKESDTANEKLREK
jgi:hypothetical protein